MASSRLRAAGSPASCLHSNSTFAWLAWIVATCRPQTIFQLTDKRGHPFPPERAETLLPGFMLAPEGSSLVTPGRYLTNVFFLTLRHSLRSVSAPPRWTESIKSTLNDKDSHYPMLKSSITHITSLDTPTAIHMLHSLAVSIVFHQITMTGELSFLWKDERRKR